MIYFHIDYVNINTWNDIFILELSIPTSIHIVWTKEEIAPPIVDINIEWNNIIRWIYYCLKTVINIVAIGREDIAT